ncbi:hypothetical protein AK812_SmicGene48468, partial [Symbiodinium microadriaticum]
MTFRLLCKQPGSEPPLVQDHATEVAGHLHG